MHKTCFALNASQEQRTQFSSALQALQEGKSTIVLRPANQILKEDGSRSQLWLCASAPRVQGAALKIFFAILQKIALLCTNMQSDQDCTAAALEEVWTLSGRLIGFGNLLLLSWPNFRDTWRKFRGAHPLPAKTIKEPAMKEGVYEEIYKTPYYWLQ